MVDGGRENPLNKNLSEKIKAVFRKKEREIFRKLADVAVRKGESMRMIQKTGKRIIGLFLLRRVASSPRRGGSPQRGDSNPRLRL